MGLDEHGQVLVRIDQRMSDRAAAAQVAEAERVVTVDKDPLVVATLGHPPSPGRRGRGDYGIMIPRGNITFS